MTDKTTKTTKTPDGAGRAYETEASGSANENGKASATVAGGDPVNSPVIGNPGEANPAAGNYDYGLAASHVSAPLQTVEVLGGPEKSAKAKNQPKYAERVVARQKGHYDGIKEVGEEFDNTQNLPTYPEDPTSWFEAAE